MALDSPGRDPTPAEVGNIGEQLARTHLEAKGYRVVETNYRCRWGEVDLITRDGPIWVFVEVRARRGDALVSPEESVTPEKARRLTMAAQDYLEHTETGYRRYPLAHRSGRHTDWAPVGAFWTSDIWKTSSKDSLNPGARSTVGAVRHLENVVEG